ncbi:hypothetical protein ISS03_00900 [Patescibacteria group bacterium]|nr:hypothetical protein [Patescibacteria group bacterium]
MSQTIIERKDIHSTLKLVYDLRITNPKRAIELIQIVERIDPNNIRALGLKAQCLMNLGNFINAYRVAKRNFELNGSTASTIIFARACIKFKKFDEAIQLLIETIKRKKYAIFYTILVEIYFKQGEHKLVIKAAMSAIKLEPNASTFIYLAKSYLATGRFVEAASAAQEAVNMRGGHSDYITLIRTLRGLGRYQDAILIARKLVSISKNNNSLLMNKTLLAELLRKNKQYEESITTLDEIEEFLGDRLDHQIYIARAYCYIETVKYKLAFDFFSLAEEIINLYEITSEYDPRTRIHCGYIFLFERHKMNQILIPETLAQKCKNAKVFLSSINKISTFQTEDIEAAFRVIEAEKI